jgi:vitamin B12/bleomycin/antimicrobial peptide transport system ATP-binding/permease protein
MERLPFNRRTWDSFLLNLKLFATSVQVGGKAKWMFAGLILFLLGINGLNVLNSYVSRDFMTAIENRNYTEFVRMALAWIGVFATSTLVVVIYRFTEERLALLWREWATRQSIIYYASDRVYYRLKVKGEIGNPDQRIADDIRSYSVTTLSLILILLNASLTVIAFSGVMWSISPLLFVVSVLYASVGTLLTYAFGRSLIRLNYDQLDKEANLRASLIYLRGNAESLATSRREAGLIQLSLRNLDGIVSNMRRIISINRNVNFFTTGYNWMIQIIPALIIAPLFISGKVQFGVITQSAIAFTHLLGAFSIIVNQFQSLSSYTAVLARLADLIHASETAKSEESSLPMAVSHDEEKVVYSGLTLRSPRSGRVLIRELSLAIPHGTHVLVRGPDETARSALFYGTAGLWETGEGRIARPKLDRILLLTEVPYLPPGTLRELFMRPWPEEDPPKESRLADVEVPEERILETLVTLKIESLVTRFGGMDKRQHWENTLPLDQQQLLVIARLLVARPPFAFLDRPTTTLSSLQVDRVLGMLEERSISYVIFEGNESTVNMERYHGILELKEDGAWEYKSNEICPGRFHEGS